MYARYYPPTGSTEQAKPAASAPAASPVTSRGFESKMSYARYIPPAKKDRTPEPVAPVVAQSRRIVFNDDDFPTPEPKKRKREGDDEAGPSSKEKKPKTKKSKKHDEKATTEDGAKEKTKKSKKSKVKGSEDTGQREEGDTETEHKEKTSHEVEADAPQKSVGQKDPSPDPVLANNESSIGKAEPANPDVGIAEERPKPKKEKKKKKKSKETTLENHDEHDSADEIRKRHRSVFEKRDKALQVVKDTPANPDEDIDADADGTKPAGENAMDWVSAEPEVHGLEPIPQPEQPPDDDTPITYETLPAWLASPIRVAAGTTALFTDLGIPPEAASVLETKGFKAAFAVQTAAIPLLLPSSDRPGDVVVSAATGSGKTLAYVLPMVQDISQETETRLRGLIVLPTRDLVQQVKTAFEACAAAFAHGARKKIHIGTAMGNKAFRDEQLAIMDKAPIYNPGGYREHLRKGEDLSDALGSAADEDVYRLGGIIKTLPEHAVRHFSKVDLLICTPGRLVDHINMTPGFTLDYVRWLVVDEADKLLAQDYQQWLSTVMKNLSTERSGARDLAGSNYSGVRKVILSATMTRDLSVYNQLRLRRPSMVVLGEELRLPPLLQESAIRVRDSYFKTLYLVDLLRSEHMVPMNPDAKLEEHPEPPPIFKPSNKRSAAANDDDSDSGSSDSDSNSDSDSDSSDSDSSSDSEIPSSSTKKMQPPTLKTTVLIFTQSNESALRLSRLLALLAPDLGPLIGTLTSATKTARRARTLHAFARGALRVLVASDLVARGIDLAALDHVVNYDVPPTATAYIHRVGRTARAGRAGHAWTLVEHAQALRFWRDFAGEGVGSSGGGKTGGAGSGGAIVRSGVVERVRLHDRAGKDGGEFNEERKEAYERALEQLQSEVWDWEKRRK